LCIHVITGKRTSKVLWLPPCLGWPLWNICVTNVQWYVPLEVSTSRSFPYSWLITWFVTRITRRVLLLDQELITLPEHLSSTPVYSGVRVTRSLVLYVCFVDFCLSLCNIFIWLLCCLSFFDIRLLITPLISSNSYITSDRNEVKSADNPNTNDTYEFIEGAMNNQREKGKNYNIHLRICRTCR
jgi:hypothetical protein